VSRQLEQTAARIEKIPTVIGDWEGGEFEKSNTKRLIESYAAPTVSGRNPPQMSTPTLTMYSTPWCGYCHRLKSQLDREGISYEVVDIEQVPEAAAVVERVNNGNQTVPTLVYSDGSAQTNPSVKDVKAKLASIG
jgi:mycoredoxin